MTKECHYYRVSELAEALNVRVETVRRWIRKGQVKSITLPKGKRIPPDEFEFVCCNGPRPRPL